MGQSLLEARIARGLWSEAEIMGYKGFEEGAATILYVDGDKVNRESFAKALEEAGFRVFKAATGREALNLVTYLPDLILLGVKPADISGIEVFRRLKADPATALIPVIQLLGRHSRTLGLQGAMEEGADAYLNKTAKPQELIAAIKVFLRIHCAEKAARTAARQWQGAVDTMPDSPGLLGRRPPAARGRKAADSFDWHAADVSHKTPSPFRSLSLPPRPDVLCREVTESAHKDRWYQVTVDPGFDGRGDAKCTVQTWTDITDRLQAEETARQRDLAFRGLAENLPDLIVRFDRQLRYLYVNRRVEAVTGLPAAAFLGRTNAELGMAEDLVALWREKLTQVLTSGQPTEFEYGFPTPAGPHFFHARLLPETGSKRTPETVLGILQDITDRKRLETQLNQAQKMEVLGRLASGVAHDFNNLLTIILGYGEILGASLPAESPGRDSLQQVLRAGERAALLTRQLLAFSRKQPLAPVVLDLNALVADMERMLSRLIGENIALVISLDPDLGWVKGDRGQLEQMILNLAVNARDAMSEGGRLVIETQNDILDQPAGPGLRGGPCVLITVSDTGCGMDEQTRARIFEPFFTMKEAGKGTGLGLTTVREVVQASGGHIEVESQLGQGTTFKIFLPQAQGSLLADALPEQGAVPGGTETVLLVEDDTEIRNLARLTLQARGYQVLMARTAEDALQRAAETTTPIHLLVTDVVLPQMSGPDLAKQLAERQPGLRILFLSGYSDDAAGRLRILERTMPFLQKPFAPATLLRKVRKVLDGAAQTK
jgi:PAS domain S-box-containing protein